MLEYLRSMRGLHRLLLIVSATLLGFALAPDPGRELQDALEEVRLIGQLPYDEYASYVRRYGEGYLDERPRIFPGTTASNLSLVRKLSKQEGFRVSEKLRFIRPWYCKLPDEHTTLAEHSRFFEAPERFYICSVSHLPDVSRLSEFLRLNKNNLDELNSVELVYYDIEFLKYGPLREEIKGLLARQPTLDDKACCRWEFSLKAPSDPSRWLGSVQSTCQPRISSLRSRESAVQWLTQLPEKFHRLVFANEEGGDSATPKIFPGVRGVWEHVSGKSQTDAVSFLETEIEASRRYVSVVGISIDERHAVWAGLAASLVVSSLLALYTFRLCQIIAGREDQIMLYPWVCLFPGVIGMCLSLASVLFLPLAANAMMVWRVAEHDSVVRWAGPIGLVLLLVCTVVILNRIVCLRRGMQPDRCVRLFRSNCFCRVLAALKSLKRTIGSVFNSKT